MATATLPSSPPTAVPMPALSLYRMPYAVYERIAEQEIIRPNDHVILLDGFLVNQMPKGPRHRNAVIRGQDAIRALVPQGWVVWAEQPIALRDGPNGDSAPEPDLAVIFGTIERYEVRHPFGSEVGLVVEIASDSDALRVDRAGLFRYAHACIPIACIVNLADRSIEVYSEPSGPDVNPGYRKSEILRPGQFLAGEIGNATTGPAAIAPIPVEAFFAPN
jgi:Uma2 family endonuclease